MLFCPQPVISKWVTTASTSCSPQCIPGHEERAVCNTIMCCSKLTCDRQEADAPHRQHAAIHDYIWRAFDASHLPQLHPSCCHCRCCWGRTAVSCCRRFDVSPWLFETVDVATLLPLQSKIKFGPLTDAACYASMRQSGVCYLALCKGYRDCICSVVETNF